MEKFDIVQNAQLPETRIISVFEKRLLNIISNIIGGEVIYENERFFVKKTDDIKISFEMEAEGLRKFALLWKLIRNGLLRPGSLLLWDEPEANINPGLLPVLTDILLELHRNDVQIIMATHSYNLAKYFELKKDKVVFHSFKKENNSASVFSDEVFGNISFNKLIEADEELLDLAYNKGIAD